MVFGGVEVEHLQFNEESLWSGYAATIRTPTPGAICPSCREAVFAGRYDEADQLVRKMQGPFTQSFLPFGDLYLDYEQAPSPHAYRRELDLTTAMHRVEYRLGEQGHVRQAFISAPANVLVLRLSCTQPGGLTFDVRMKAHCNPK